MTATSARGAARRLRPERHRIVPGVAVATLTVSAPERVRGGLPFAGRFDVKARSDIADARLVLHEGWLEGMSVNTIEPSPVSETSRNGRLQLDLGRLAAGDTHRLYTTGAMIAVSTIALMQVGLSYVGIRFRRLRPVLEGEPIVIVQDGHVIERNLRRDRITLDEVLEEARQQQIGSLDDVAWALLELNGKISFLPK